MRAEITICDWCRYDGTIRAATGYYWNRTAGRMFDVCTAHLNMVLEPGIAAGLFTHPGDCEENLFDLPGCGIFCEIPEELRDCQQSSP